MAIIASSALLLLLAVTSSVSASVIIPIFASPLLTVSSPNETTSVNSTGSAFNVTSEAPLTRVRRADDDTKAKMTKVMHLVEVAKIQDCVGRVICALNCNPDGYGKDGKKVFSMMLAIQTSGAVQETEMRFYLNAGMTGRKFKQTNVCDECNTTYANCIASSADLIDVVSLINIDPAAV